MNPPLLRALLSSALSLIPIAAATADEGRTMPAPPPPLYTQECGSCHVAFAPGLLPARSWQRVMDALDRHYGTDASLDGAAVGQISAWLQAHAGTGRASAQPPQDRITRSAWFVREHRKVEPVVWHLPSVKSATNCAACHDDADRGRFDDDRLRRPDGLTPRQRRAWTD